MLQPVEATLTDEALEEGVVDAVMGRTSLQPVRNTQLVRVSFDAFDPELAAKVPNELAKIYILADLESRMDATRKSTEFLTQQVQTLKDRLAQSERALQDFLHFLGERHLLSHLVGKKCIHARLAPRSDEFVFPRNIFRRALYIGENGTFIDIQLIQFGQDRPLVRHDNSANANVVSAALIEDCVQTKEQERT